MHRLLYLLLSTAPLFMDGSTAPADFKVEIVHGYYPSWRAATHPPSKFDFSGVNRVGHCFAYPSTEGELIIPPELLDPALVTAVHAQGAEVSLVLGGWGQCDGFSPTCADPAKRARFVGEIAQALTTLNYDGIEFDWEFPTSAADRNNLTTCIAELRAILGSEREIALAVPASNWSGQWFSASLLQHADRLHVMTYDYAGSWSSQSGHHSALRADACATPYSMEQALAYWRGRGVQNEDIVLGVPFYGRSFDSGSLCQPFTQTGSASYADLLAMEQSGDWKRHWSTAARVPWLEERQGSGIWSYENARSVREKALFALKEDVAGVMIWELTHDVVRDKHLLLEALTEPLLR
ncbi:MAG: glycoside hydrolase family 18 protein [Planctomycetota bacterium]|nr:glycoside hydrolase family 18 protein [Planctomycetota bacterium]